MLRYFFLQVFCSTSALLFSQSTFPEIDNWSKSENIKKYDADILWDYINGAADYYLAYSFQELEVCEYSRNEDDYIKAEVYRHENSINAFGIYAYERPPGANYIEIATEAYMVHSALNFYCGNYYVKVHTHLSDEEALNAIKSITSALAQNKCSQDSGQAFIKLLPRENKVAHTEKYFPANYLGLSFLNNALEALYKIDENEYKVFVIEEISNEQAQETVAKYLKFAKTDTLVENNSIYPIDDMFNGLVTILLKDNFLYGIHDTPNDELAKELLGEVPGTVYP